jgi:hypothetical protein
VPAAAQEYKIAVVSMLHAHVWLHLGTMMKGEKVKLIGVAETMPELLARAKRTDQIRSPRTAGQESRNRCSLPTGRR